jgi:hypothetical protein
MRVSRESKRDTPSRRGGRRPGAGRPKGTRQTTPALAKIQAMLSPPDLAYLRAWDDGNDSECLRRLIERARTMWPNGPSSNPLTARRGQRSTPDPRGA